MLSSLIVGQVHTDGQKATHMSPPCQKYRWAKKYSITELSLFTAGGGANKGRINFSARKLRWGELQSKPFEGAGQNFSAQQSVEISCYLIFSRTGKPGRQIKKIVNEENCTIFRL